ncbi:TIR domain-containing protein [Cryobacterium sp. TMT2-14]|uniref:TIR domain-containing protein n=1 Tax=Cryobacterium sp. TMT2-14 TaxID=1259245 RepID=UPI00106B61C8|nr:TIR domain-containing protein [Cryobacterium sp. TMT2-14]TFC34999.1 TIR domain-containing protein [Cryobacterium sp. TMT2-14]
MSMDALRFDERGSGPQQSRPILHPVPIDDRYVDMTSASRTETIMRVFISWSGPKTQLLGQALKDWLPHVTMGHVTAFLSSKDIKKGSRGLTVIAEELEGIDFGLVLLTKENQHESWIQYESGALGRSLQEGRVTPLLVDLTEKDVTGPLTQFQMTLLANKEDVFTLVTELSAALDVPLPTEEARVLFDHYWPDLERAVAIAAKGSPVPEATRSQESMLEEILLGMRRLQRDKPRPAVWALSSEADDDSVVDELRSLLPEANRIRIVQHSFTGQRVCLVDTSDRSGIPEGRSQECGTDLAALALSFGGEIRIRNDDGQSTTYFPDFRSPRRRMIGPKPKEPIDFRDSEGGAYESAEEAESA